MPYIHTVGHSNQPIEPFLANLRAFGIEIVLDVRSQPSSRYSPHFNRRTLAEHLGEVGLRYAFMGDVLGGRPDSTRYYDEAGHVRYDLWSEDGKFRRGIEQLTQGAEDNEIALLCSEEAPQQCHRHLLIARVLGDAGWDRSRIVHIRADGSALPDDAIAVQADLFGGEERMWRSPQSVLHRLQPNTSLAG